MKSGALLYLAWRKSKSDSFKTRDDYIPRIPLDDEATSESTDLFPRELRRESLNKAINDYEI